MTNKKRDKRFVLIIQLFLFVVLIVAVFLFVSLNLERREATVEVNFLDIGQGGAVHVRTPSGRDYLIDTGPDSSVLAELSKVLPWYDRKIDAVFITHPDKDHMGGVFDVINYYRVGRVYDNGFKPDTQVGYFYDARVWKNVKSGRSKGWENDVYILDDDYNVYLRRLSPDRPEEFDNDNDNSLTYVLEFGDFDVLLTGDIGFDLEGRVVERGRMYFDDGLEVLQVSHHGSKNATSEDFLKKISPRLAVVQAGVKNSYGHPSPETLRRIEGAGAEILCTCTEGGMIRIVSDGEEFSVLK